MDFSLFELQNLYFLLDSQIFSSEAIAGYLSTAIFTLISVALMYLVLKAFVFKPVGKLIDARQEKINEDLDKARKSKEEAAKLEAQAHEHVSEANKKAGDIVHAAKTAAQVQGDQLLEEARQQASSIIEKAEEEAKRLKVNAYQEMRKDIVNLSLTIASKVVSERLDKKADIDLVEKLLSEEMK